MPQLSQHQSRRAWDEGIASDMRSAYFGELVCRYETRQRRAITIQLLLSTGAAAALVARIDTTILPVILTVIVSAIGLYSLVAQNHKRAIEASNQQALWMEATRQYRYVWEHTWEDDAEGKLTEADEFAAKASLGAASFPIDEKRLTHWLERTEAIWVARAAG